MDLAGVSTIDAAGIGQLVRAYNIATASQGALRIVNTSSRVREMLERVRLFAHFTADTRDADREDRTVFGAYEASSVNVKSARPSC